MLVRVFITSGTTADCKFGEKLISEIDAEYLFADRGYDTSEIIDFAVTSGINVVTAPKKNRKEQRKYDKKLHKLRRLVETPFASQTMEGNLYQVCKNTSSFLLMFTVTALLFGQILLF